MSPTNFLRQLFMLPKGAQGDGFKRSHKISLGDLKTAAGLTLTGATAPLITNLETNALAVQVAAGQTAAGSFTWTVPLDYDTALDKIDLNVLVVSAANTDAPTLDATIYRKRAGLVLTADLNPAASAAIPKSATPNTAAAVRTVALATGSGTLPGDVLTINLITAAHATDAVNIYGIELVYRSTLVASNENSR